MPSPPMARTTVVRTEKSNFCQLPEPKPKISLREVSGVVIWPQCSGFAHGHTAGAGAAANATVGGGGGAAAAIVATGGATGGGAATIVDVVVVLVNWRRCERKDPLTLLLMLWHREP